MSWRLSALAAVAALALAGCANENEFGGAGGSFGGSAGSGGAGGSGGFGGSGGSSGSNQPGLSLARDVCIRDIESQGGTVVRVDSMREIQNRAEIVVETRRSPASRNTERRLCTFYYNTGLHDTRPI